MFDFIIPVCNIDEIDFKYRVNNINRIIESLPNDVSLILVEQDMGNNTFGKTVNFRNNDKYINVKYSIFNKPWLQNIGVRASDRKDIIIGESDCLVEKPKKFFSQFSTYVKNLFWCHTWNRIQYHEEDYNIVSRDEIGPKRGMAEGGLIYFTKDYYNSIGGANEWFQELGGMDNELIRRAEAKVNNKPFNWTIHHYWHPQNRMKKNDWSMSVFRNANREKYNYIRKNILHVINKMNKLDFGNTSLPLCATMKWEDVISKGV